MSHAQRFIENDRTMRAVNPGLAALARERTIQSTINFVEERHRSLLAAEIKDAKSIALNKAKLRAYYACKQKDKAECRSAIDAFMEVAGEMLQLTMDGTIAIRLYSSHQWYDGAPGMDENARRLAESLKNTVLMLEYIYEDM
jgi:hypothetical protein